MYTFGSYFRIFLTWGPPVLTLNLVKKIRDVRPSQTDGSDFSTIYSSSSFHLPVASPSPASSAKEAAPRETSRSAVM